MKVIAESAFNHQGDLNSLKELAMSAKKSGADFFTVQVMHVDSFCVDDYEKYDLYKKTEFTHYEWLELFDFCKLNQIEVIPCVLEETSYHWCYSYGFRIIKLHATDITNKPFLELIAEHEDVKVILETQCATAFEVEFALSILGLEKIEALFTGYSNYPTEVEDLNLNVLDTYKEKYGLNLGYADHSIDTMNVPLMVLSKGCKYIEKHITLTRNNRNYDYQVSLYPNEFTIMVNALNHYKVALGEGVKHPSRNESKFRTVMYKKVIAKNMPLKRADFGNDYITSEINKFDKKDVVVALIARLKSQRLKQKVIKPFHNDEMIIDLYNRINNTEKYKTVLATSNLIEDTPLGKLFEEKGFEYYEGDATSVIDRMLGLAYKEKAGGIFRVTGDNPFTDPFLMEQMIELLTENDLDYVKVNNVPFGVGAELFSTKYLWNLYLRLDTTKFSEYLTWYVLNDENVRMGCIDVTKGDSLKLVNLSVDFQEDFDRCKLLLNRIGKKEFSSISLDDILAHSKMIEKIDDSKHIKLPMGDSISLKNYLSAFENKNYVVRRKI